MFSFQDGLFEIETLPFDQLAKGGSLAALFVGELSFEAALIENGVDRVVRRTARAAFKGKVRGEKTRQFLEVTRRDRALHAAQSVQIRRARRFLDQTIEPCGGGFRVRLAVGRQALEDAFRVIGSRTESRDLEDIVTAEDNLAAADAILEVVRGLTSNPDIRLIASLACGRKTMSAFMALAMTLVGRPEDRLCHVLVNAPFDSPWLHPKFYFPTHPPTQHKLRDRSGKTVEVISGAKARIELAEAPFVPLAKLFEKE